MRRDIGVVHGAASAVKSTVPSFVTIRSEAATSDRISG